MDSGHHDNTKYPGRSESQTSKMGDAWGKKMRVATRDGASSVIALENIL